MLFHPWNVFSTCELALSIVCVQCPFLDFVLSCYAAQVLSERFWNGSIHPYYYWHHFCFHYYYYYYHHHHHHRHRCCCCCCYCCCCCCYYCLNHSCFICRNGWMDQRTVTHKSLAIVAFLIGFGWPVLQPCASHSHPYIVRHACWAVSCLSLTHPKHGNHFECYTGRETSTHHASEPCKLICHTI